MAQNVIYHNPRCSKSREALKLLQDNAMPVEIIEYLKTPPSVHVLDGLCTLLGLTPQELLRSKENRFKELSLSLKDARSREEWLQILADNPKLIERPIVVYNGKATLGRPPQRVLELKS
ncbi:MAG: arsenate reductase (glutaredoxin) [Deferribacteres bacterium]|nr:arsenate reductase (glutaredoxin) [candidate division KSB1 bacterium]MCB9509746.1 arsenate reductase (glutaredoxin) [Deferribacteres bacterium]